MEQIKQILKQLALNLDLNIAMCDMLEDHAKRIGELEKHYSAQKTRLDGLYRQVSEANYVAASKSYEARKGLVSGLNASTRDSTSVK